MITVIGLGFNEGSITKRGLDTIMGSEMIIFRTLRTVPAKALQNYCNGSFDYLYEKAEDFDELNSTIADELIRLSESYPNLVYCVDGDGYKDSSVVELRKRTEVYIIPGPFDLAVEPSTACTYISAYDDLSKFYPDPSVPLCVYNVDDANIAGDVKLFLMRFYDADTTALICNSKSKTYVKLHDVDMLHLLDKQKNYTEDTAIYIENGYNASFADLLRIMTRLTAPDGCPWDKAQTHESIRINLLEEAYETVQTITDGDIDGMIEELGDVLLQVVFHCDIALRSGEFMLEDVIKRLNDKLIGRHTHIFGNDKADGEGGALSVWEKNKMKEKHQDTFAAAVNDIPACFPALLRAQKAAKRAEKGGWKRGLTDIKNALNGDLDALIAAHEKGDKSKVAHLLGNVLLSLAWLGHAMDANCEQALLDTVASMQKTYTLFEKAVLRDGKDVNNLTQQEWQKYYSGAKDESV